MTYRWDFSQPGRGVPNALAPAVPAQVLPVGGLALDADGVYTHTRVIDDPSVVDPLGNREAITLTFTATNQHQTFSLRTDNPGLPAQDVTVCVMVKGAGKLVLGSSSDAGGHAAWRTAFDATDTWTERTATYANYSSASASNIAIRPAADATFPLTVSIYAPMLLLPGDTKPTLAQYRAIRRSGVAMPPMGFSNAVVPNTGGGLLPTDGVRNLMAELDPITVTHHAMSCWVNLKRLPAARGFMMAFSRVNNPTDNPHLKGNLGVFGVAENKDFWGRLRYHPNDNEAKSLFSPYLDGSGWVHVHLNYGATSSDFTVADGEVVHELLVNGIPLHARSVANLGAYVPRVMALMGMDYSAKPAQRTDGAFTGAIERVRYEPNTTVSRAAVLARVKADRASLPNLAAEPLDACVIVEGDSTSQQRGSPAYMYARILRKPGRLFFNHARGGSWYQGGIASNTDYIGTGQRRAMRLEAMAAALDQGYSKVFTLWTPGENDTAGSGLLGVGANIATAVSTLTNFIIADLEAVDPTRTRTRSIFVSMKMSDFSGGDPVKDQVRAYWAALDAIYTEQVDAVNAPFLYRAPVNDGTLHDYFIAMHKWVPTNGTYTWADWEALAIDAKAGTNGARDIVSADGQHWTQGWNDHVSKAVHVPCLRKIFELEGV